MRGTHWFVVLGLVLLFNQGALADDPPGSMKIGLILPLTGPRSSIGEDAAQGARLALADLEKSGKVEPGSLVLVFEDSQGNPAKGVSAYKKLVLQGAKFIITQNSNVSLAVAPLVDGDGILQLAITTTSERYSRPKDNTFRTNGPTKPEADLIIQTLVDRVAKSSPVGVVTMQDEYPVTLQRYVLEGLKRIGFEAVSDDFLPQETDFRAIIARLSSKKVAAVVFLGYQTQGGTFVKQFRELGSPAGLLIANTPVNNREFFEVAGTAAEGVYVTYPLPDLSHPAAREFQRRFGKQANFFSSNAYDGVIIANYALSRCGNTAEISCLRRRLYGLKDFRGMSGHKGFDDLYGDMKDKYYLLVAKGGRFVLENSRDD